MARTKRPIDLADRPEGEAPELDLKFYDTPETTYDTDLLDFLNENAIEDKNFYCVIFRMDSINPKRLQYIEEFISRIPRYSEIAQKYGPGSYTLQVQYHDKTGIRRAKRSRLDIADDVAFPAAMRGQQQAAPAPVQMQGQSNAEMFRFFQGMMNTMVSLIQTVNQPKNGGFDMGELQKTLSGIALSNLRSQNKLIEEMGATKARQTLGLPPESEEEEMPEEKGNWIFELLKDMVQNFAEKILDPNGMAKKLVQSTPEYQKALEQPEEFAAAYKQLIDEGEAKDKVDAILTALGVAIPA